LERAGQDSPSGCGEPNESLSVRDGGHEDAVRETGSPQARHLHARRGVVHSRSFAITSLAFLLEEDGQVLVIIPE
jgi:hypothetical protein